MKNNLLILLIFNLCLIFGLQAQEVPRTIVVEHFTNSRCGICANRNPGFYANLNDQEGVLHLAVHPSSPYSTCVFNQANQSENDDRTNYYGIYGGTPRLVIQGNALSAGTNYSSATIFEPYQDQTTPVSLRIRQTKLEGEITISVTVKAETDNTLGSTQLFLALAEQEVLYDAPNGEDVHYDVFRRTFTGEPTGIAVDVPATAGDSIVISASLMPNTDWVFSELFALAVLQETDSKAVLQATASDPSDNEPVVSTQEVNTLPANIFPNPVQDQLEIQLEGDTKASYQLFNSNGQVLQSGNFIGQTRLEMANYTSGIYWLEILSTEGKAVRKLVK